MAAVRRATQKKGASSDSPVSSPNSTRVRQHQPHLPDDASKRGSNSQPQAPPKPTTPLGFSTGHNNLHPRSRLSRQDDDDAPYINANDTWEQSQGPYITSSRGSKRTPDCKQYLAYTTCAANKISRVPGPGSYNSSLKPGGPSFSMGSRAPLGSVERSYSPGPGTYDVRTKNSGPSFSMAPKVRLPVSQQDLNPGPGTYSDLSSSFGRGLSFSIRERFK